MKIYWECILIFSIMIVFISCYKKRQDIEYTVPIPQLSNRNDSVKVQSQKEMPLPTPPTIENDVIEKEIHSHSKNLSNGKYLSVFPNEFSHVLDWGTVKFSQRGSEVKDVFAKETRNYGMHALFQSVQVKDTIAFDTVIGDLQNIHTKNSIEKKIVFTIQSFMSDFMSGIIDKTLQKYVLSDVIEIVARKISRNREYVHFITEYRIGKIEAGDENERHAKIRVFAQYKEFSSRVVILMYFEKRKNSSEWIISSIEGEFNDLLQPYLSKGRFLPSGTMGLTQTF